MVDDAWAKTPLCDVCQAEAWGLLFGEPPLLLCLPHMQDISEEQAIIRRFMVLGRLEPQWKMVVALIVEVEALRAEVDALKKLHAGAHGNAIMARGLDENVKCVVCGCPRRAHVTERVTVGDSVVWDLHCTLCPCPRFNGG